MSNFNFNNLNDYENFGEEEIRPPDNTIREILVNDYNHYYDNIIPYDYDNDLQLACIESIKEQEEYEKKRLEMLEKIRLRVQTFKDVVLKIKKISMIDPQILKFYNIISSVIDSYCACSIDIYECDKVMYDEIFSTLKTIRLTTSEFDLFKNLFIMKN